MLLQQFGGVSGASYYASALFEQAGKLTIFITFFSIINNNTKIVNRIFNICTGVSSKIGTTSAAIVQVPAVILGVLLLDKAGRRSLLLVRKRIFSLLYDFLFNK